MSLFRDPLSVYRCGYFTNLDLVTYFSVSIYVELVVLINSRKDEVPKAGRLDLLE
jgi:hypothetical protein